MLYHQTDNKPHIITFTYPHGFCAIPGTLAFQKPSKYYFTCLTDSEIDCLSYIDLQKLFDQSQQLERPLEELWKLFLKDF